MTTPKKKIPPEVKPAAESKPAKKGFSKTDCKPFVDLLQERRRALLGDMSHLEDDVLKRSLQDSSGDLSSVPIHMADLGSDNYEQDVTLNLMETERDELREIVDAIERIEQGIYGLCEECEKMVPKARLQALPYARLCIECKKEEEEGAT